MCPGFTAVMQAAAGCGCESSGSITTPRRTVLPVWRTVSAFPACPRQDASGRPARVVLGPPPCRRARTANLAGRTSCDRQWAPMKSVLTALGLGALLALVNYWVLWNLGGTPACVACAAVLLGGPFVLALALAGILPAIGGPAHPPRPPRAQSAPAR